METLAERIKTLEDKVSKLESVNMIKEDSEEPMGKKEMVSGPNK